MNRFYVTKNGTFIKCCWSGIDTRKMEQIIADMQKEEPDSEFKLYSWNGELTLFSILPIMVEKQVFREELIAILERCENEENFKFTDKQWEALALTLETANTQHNDDGAWTYIMYRAKYNFIEGVKAFLGTQHVHLY